MSANAIRREMIKQYRLKKLGYDFMGYTFNNTNELSFHHLIVPKKDCKRAGLGDGYLYWNGAILKQSTSHDYLHLIQRIDEDLFKAITDEMIDENVKGKLDIINLKRIREALLYFEKEHQFDRDKKGRVLVKREYICNRIDL